MQNLKTLVVVTLAVLAAGACTKKQDAASSAAPQASTAAATELKIEDVKVGTGAEAVVGKLVSVHYTGTLTDGKKFDSSVDKGEPFRFPLGAGQVILGWEKGILGMKVGGKRKLTIPPSLGYAEREIAGLVPPNSTLLFDVELVAVQ